MKTRSWSETTAQPRYSAGSFIVFLSLLVLSPRVSANTGGSAMSEIPENWEARGLMKDAIFAPVREAASIRGQVIVEPESRRSVAFQSELQGGALYLVFSNRADKGYPRASAGDFIIKRSLKDGSFLQAKVFLQGDPGCYLRLFPIGGPRNSRSTAAAVSGRTSMDIILYGATFQSGVVLPVGFDTLLTAPFSRIVELSRDSVDWPTVFPPQRGSGDQRLARIVQALRPRLGGLPDADDGAQDSDGRLVFIRDGSPADARGGFNCSGFAKWIVDGFYGPLAGTLMNIEELKARQTDARGNRWSSGLEEERDPYFGLDWTRNLARTLEAARTGKLPDAEALDAREVPGFRYVEDVGYPVSDLPIILYLLARRDPGMVYLGSVNGPMPGSPVLRQHHHVVVLFPYFDENRTFRVVAMERNLETSLDSMRTRYAKDYVHLVRFDSSGEFVPPKIE